MSEENTRLRIHAQVAPDTAAQTTPQARKTKRIIFTRQNRERVHEKLTFTDRLLRNSALACALLLAILALGNIDHPITRAASERVEKALNMHIDLDDSIGSLSFVRNLMPESALVFFNLSAEHEFARPVSGELRHSYSDAQPWLLFSCPAGSDVAAVADGTVTAVSELSGGTFGLLVDHGSGMESVCAYLSDCAVQPGDTVKKGSLLGHSDASVYFELRENEAAVDPTARMGL